MHEGSRTDAAFGTAVTATARVVGDRQRGESTNRDGHDALVEVAEGQLEDALAIAATHPSAGAYRLTEGTCREHNIF